MQVDFTTSGLNFASYQWIQNASQNPNKVSANGTPLANPFNDGTLDANGNNVNYPFYYLDGEHDTFSTAPFEPTEYGNTLYFSDTPGMNQIGSFVAETTLVGIDKNGNMTPLGTFTWGYAIGGNGAAFPRPVTISNTPTQQP